MYTIIGRDQNEYGPVTAEQVRQWIAEGRIDAQTQVQAEGSGLWKPLTDFPGFAEPLKRRALASTLAKTTTKKPDRMSRMAIASLVLGVLGLIPIGVTALFGLGLGIVALVKIKRSKGALGGFGLALAGTIVSAVFLLMALGLGALWLSAMGQMKARAPAYRCMNNLRQLCWGMRTHLDEHNKCFPSASSWGDDLRVSIGAGNTFKCPQGDRNQRSHFAFNAQLSGIERSKVKVPHETVLFFEIDGGWNVSGGPELLLSRPRHPWPPDKRGAVAVAFVDGHVEMATESRLQTLRWTP